MSFYRSDNQIIAVGSAEGEVVIVNHQTGKIVANFSSKKRQSNSINEDEEENGNSSIESLIFSTPETNQLLTADVDGNLMGKIIPSNLVIRNFLVTLKLFLNAKCSLSQTFNQSTIYLGYLFYSKSQKSGTGSPKNVFFSWK